jgi:TP53 regulating kinase and related kinases
MVVEIIQQGAEAVIYKIDNKIVKDRIPKKYRFPDLDNKLRKSRTKSEAKIIGKLKGVIDVPELLADPGMGRMIHMEFIDGLKLSENLEKLDWVSVCKKIGVGVAKMHDAGIVHGDLTTSNLIWKEGCGVGVKGDGSGGEKGLDGGKVYFIDFGLGFHSSKVEDKAVDLHLLKQALGAKHYLIAEEGFDVVVKSYVGDDGDEGVDERVGGDEGVRMHKLVVERLKVVEGRGRYK